MPEVNTYGKYTIGEVIDIKLKSKGRMLDISFIYYRKEKIFKNNNRVRNNYSDIIGKRFLILYLSNKENHSQILLEYPVPDSIQSAPPEGWKELPNWAKTK